MNFIVQVLKSIFVFGSLTLFTQVGGIIYLTYKLIYSTIPSSSKKIFYKPIIFSTLYLLSTFLIVPIIAKQFGRVPMNWLSNNTQSIAPHTLLTCLLNRHYVSPKLKFEVFEIAEAIHLKYPETQLRYLDANFPFWNGYPLWPHLSHDDGKKIDLSFFYKNKKGATMPPPFGFLGYGICEQARKGEVNQAQKCADKGYWQYNILNQIVPSFLSRNRFFDEQKTKDLLIIISKRQAIKKIFLEPHLKTRLDLQQYNKIRFHGCQSVRHDDHIHLQL